MTRRAATVLLTCLWLLPPVAAQSDRARHIDELISAYHQLDQFHGSALVAEKGQVILKKGCGLANREFGIPNAPDTKFRLGSITKQFTATLVLQLVEQGKLRLDGKIGDYLPECPKKVGERITIHQLLNHTSGIPSYTGFPGFADKLSRDPLTPLELARMYWEKELEFEPGSRYAYNNSGYHLLGVLIEKITGHPYAKALQERILTPLGMKDTGYDDYNTILPRRASGYRPVLDGYLNAAYLDMSLPYSAGALYSTVEDLHVWDQALYSDKLLAPKSKDLMFQPGMNNYGYGWIIDQAAIPGLDRKVPRIAHGGGINGFNTLLTRLPEERRLIVLLSNTPGRARLGEVNDGIMAILHGQKAQPPKQSIAQVLYPVIQAEGVQAAAARYRKLKAEQPERLDFRERELNTLGYALMTEAKKVKEAVEIFKLNVEAYPKSSNVHDSLGEAYARDGQKALAIQHCEKALALDPKNANAAKRLEKLRQE
ncbi:MAG: tetratricopeptide repeat protein [Acidobacteria bacterium]|nr:tetratricopeptide repeat protein [Acidobacteriota bacterium]